MSPPVRTEAPKSWKKINEERKALKKKRKQERLIKELEASKVADGLPSVDINNLPPKDPPSTISIAVPGSILENAQSSELRSYVAGQIARAACIFRVHEIIVFDDVGLATARETKRNYDIDADDDGASQTVRGSCLQLARILQYLECPQYLRKFFFPLHKDLKYSGLLNPLDTPHHLRQQNVFRYREGIIAEKKAKDGFSYVNVGLLNDVLVDKAIAPGVRVTVKLDNLNDTGKKLRGTVVSPDEPRRETGIYWGYTVRIAHSLAEIFTKSPYKGGYDLTIGTSDHGTSVREVPNGAYNFNHLLIVFGGLQGLETALANDDKLTVDDPALLFDHYINVLPRQGSRTIRTEEALLIALAALQEKFNPIVPEMEAQLEEFQLPRSEDTGMHVEFKLSKKARKRKHAEMQKESEQQQHVEQQKSFAEEKPQTLAINGHNPLKKRKNNSSNESEQQQQNKHALEEKLKTMPINNNNPFKKKKNHSAKKQSKEILTEGSAADEDFEIVPVQAPYNAKSVASNDDLSRFD